MFKTLLFNIKKFIVWYVYQWSLIINFFRPRDYEVSSVYLYYTSNKSARSSPVTNAFWKGEAVYPDQDEYTANVTEEFIDGKLQEQQKNRSYLGFMHPHDVCVDNDENIYVPQWASKKSYPIKLERV